MPVIIKRGIVVVAILIVVGMAALICINNVARSKPVSLSATLNPVIIIDPGHGGIDGGAVGVDGIVEKDINLNISLKLRDMLTMCGYNVVMTRVDDRSIHDEGVTGVKNQKTSDLVNRLKFTKTYPNSIYICVHQNQFAASNSYGAQIFYGVNNPDSKDFAIITQRMFVDMLQPNNKRLQKEVDDNIYIIYKAETPAILVECGFLSNPAEAYKLVDPEYQKDVAFVLSSSAMEFLNTRERLDTRE